MPTIRLLIAILLSALLSIGCSHGAARAESPSLDAVLRSHLDAIRNRDLDRLMATVTAGETLVTLLPNGKKLDGRQAYRDLHVDWFADPGWRMQLEEVHRQVRSDTAVVLLRYGYWRREADGREALARNAWLTLVFAREDGQWRLVYDQNTSIPKD